MTDELPICFRLTEKSYLPEISQNILNRALFFENWFKGLRTQQEWISWLKAKTAWEKSNEYTVYRLSEFVAFEKLQADQYFHYMQMFQILESDTVKDTVQFMIKDFENDQAAITGIYKQDKKLIAEPDRYHWLGNWVPEYFHSKYCWYYSILRSLGRIEGKKME